MLIGAVTTFRDIGERKSYIAEIEHKSNFDALTGLPNRNLLTDRIIQGIARCRETGELLAVVLINLDRFKAVNDSLGHAAGGSLLKEAARRFAAVTPGDVTLAAISSLLLNAALLPALAQVIDLAPSKGHDAEVDRTFADASPTLRRSLGEEINALGRIIDSYDDPAALERVRALRERQ